MLVNVSSFSIHVLFCFFAAISQEKTVQMIGSFDHTKLKHVETEESNPLPDASS